MDLRKYVCGLSMVALTLCSPAAVDAGIVGEYVEARTCDVFSAPCFANGEANTRGDHAVLAWSVDKGSWNGVRLDGLRIAASLDSEGTFGTPSEGKTRAVVYIDRRATKAQGSALLAMARRLAPQYFRDIVKVHRDKISFESKGNRVQLAVGSVIEVETQALNLHCDTVCGNEEQFYPALSLGSDARCAKALTHFYRGSDLGVRWSDPGGRSAMIGRFELQLEAS